MAPENCWLHPANLALDGGPAILDLTPQSFMYLPIDLIIAYGISARFPKYKWAARWFLNHLQILRCIYIVDTPIIATYSYIHQSLKK